MTIWILYALTVSALVHLAAHLAERGVRGLGLPRRWVWAGAMVLTVLLPLALGVTASRAAPGAGTQPPPAAPIAGVPSAWDTIGAGGWWASLPTAVRAADGLVLPLWITASVLTGLLLLGGGLRLRRQLRRWPRVRLPGGEVRVSEDFGPALVTGRPPAVVLPRWALGLGAGPLAIVLAHEEEHRNGGDTLLLPLAAWLTVAAPWNPILWRQLRRLREAVELDCDARVVRRGIPSVAYARLLLAVGGAAPHHPVPSWAALAAHPSFLERRLTMLVKANSPRGRRVALPALALAGGVLALACTADAPPLTPDDTPSGPEAAATEAGSFNARFRAVGTDTQAAEERRIVELQATEAEGGRFRIRDTEREPLVLVDGERLASGALNQLDPDRIERIEVLKGATARERYGPDAADGVILIFLKKE
ncbi:MAG: M56 family metallopeptidase [Longimicrobiales bacterium]|nr:M56 family metallopeptidase [Longimicrobiales bacterium]